MKRIAIIGGGISGLATAYRIRRGLRASGVEHELVVYESADRPTGKIRSERMAGYLIESGPNGYLDNEPATERLVADLGLVERLVPASPDSKTRFLFRRGRLVPLPTSPPGFLLSPLISLRGRLRVPLEKFVRPASAELEETVHQFVTRRLGSEVTEGMIDAMVSGIYAGDTHSLSIEAAFPRIVEIEQQYGSLLNGQAALAREREAKGEDLGQTGQPRGQLASFQDGIDTLVRTLAEELGPAVQTGTRVERLERRGAEYLLLLSRGEQVNSRRYLERFDVGFEQTRADAAVLAVPAYAAAWVLRHVAPRAQQSLAEIPYASAVVLGLGFLRQHVGHDLQGFGFLAPRREGLRTLGVRFSSSTFPRRAPEGHVLLEAIVGGVHDPEALCVETRDIVELVLDELKAPLALRGRPELTAVFRHHRAIPQYTIGHQARVARAEAAVAERPGLFITGNALHGIAMNKCIVESERIAERVVEHLMC